MNYQSIKPTSTRGQLLAMVGWLCAVCGMLRCILTVQRYDFFLQYDDIFCFFLGGEGGAAEIGGTCGCLYTDLYTLRYTNVLLTLFQ